MLNADSSTLNSDSEVQTSAAPPTIPSAAALSWTMWTRLTIRSIGVPGSARLISLTRKLDSSARPVSPSRARERNARGTKDSSAKYAIIAARCVPRSAWNLRQRSRLRTRTRGSFYAFPMDAQQALADLTEISSQIQAAVVFDDQGKVAGSTLDRAAADLLELADGVAAGNGPLSQLEVATLEGSVFVVREGKTRIAATTAPEPTVGLVFYDLKSALRQISSKPERKAPARKAAPKNTAAAKKTTTPKKKA